MYGSRFVGKCFSVFVNATDVGSGNTTCCVFGFTTESNNSDDNESDDSDPVDGGLYLFNKLRFSFFKTIVIGDFDFIVDVSGSNMSTVKNVSFIWMVF